jgi:hypothetical protein
MDRAPRPAAGKDASLGRNGRRVEEGEQGLEEREHRANEREADEREAMRRARETARKYAGS